MRGAAVWVAAACACAAPAYVERGTMLGAEQVATVELRHPSAAAPDRPYGEATKRRKGPGRGPGCRCNRRQCVAKRMRSHAETLEWCGVHEAILRSCFVDAKLTGRAVVTVQTGAQGQVEQAGVLADARVADCLYDEARQASFPAQPNQIFQTLYLVER